ncbi:MAG: hypothetical protein H0U66_06105 [Gemmatimonadaceae bacterium]|nr:hypothetical protein [Gemmatimonadaceae bacterium]
MTNTSGIPDLDPIGIEMRRLRREEQFGACASCALCGMANIDVLTPAPRSFLESHHAVGRANDNGLTVPLCRNCHAEVTEGYRNAGVPLNLPPTFLHKLVAVLRALGAFLAILGQRLATWAEALIRLLVRLDATVPSWRSWEEAKP